MAVIDVAKYKLRGPVRKLRMENARWNEARAEWQPPTNFTLITFRPDGKASEVDFNNPGRDVFRTTFRYDERGRLLEVQRGAADRSVGKEVYSYDQSGRHVRTVSVDADGVTKEIETCQYDSTGRKTKVTFLPTPPSGVSFHATIEGMEQAFAAPGATTMTTRYGERELPEEVVLHDANHAVVLRATFTRDREGRTVREEVTSGGQFPVPGLSAADAGAASKEEAAALAALMASVFENQVLHGTTYAYDRQGRVLERSRRMGALSESRTIFTYDDRDNPIEEATDDQSREIGPGPDGTPRARNETLRRHYVRHEYQYDREGNWIERILSTRLEVQPTFQRMNVERRQITYFEK